MGKAGDNNPFRSGHTAALDLDQMEAEAEDGWPGNKPKKNEWASKEWSGGKDRWPEDFGGSSGTAALDLSEFNEYDGPNRGKKKPRGGGGGDFWDDDDGVGVLEDDFDRPKMRTSDGFGDFGESGSSTMSLDLEDLGGGPPPMNEPLGNQLRRRAERNEDFRDPHSHSDQRGRRSYEGGQGDASRKEERTTRGGGQNLRKRTDSEPNILDEIDDIDGEDNDLMPHERTMAFDIESVAGGAQGVHVDPSMSKTNAIKPPELAQLPAQELAPHERTMAFDLQAMADEEEPTLEKLSGPQSSSNLRRMTGKAAAVPDASVRTTVIDQNDIEKMVANEADSGGKLLIFVPGASPVPFDLRPGVTNIGRERTNHLVISDPFCSRRHLRLKKQGDQFILRDNGSDNGTVLNNRPMIGNEDTILNRGDDIIVGSTVLRFITGTPSAGDYDPPALPLNEPPMVPVTGNMPGQPNQSGSSGRSSSLIPIIVLVVIVLGTLMLGALLIFLFFFQGSASAQAALTIAPLMPG